RCAARRGRSRAAVRQGRGDERGSGSKALAPDRGAFENQCISYGSTADRGNGAQDDRLCRTQPKFHGLAGPSNGKYAEPNGVENFDGHGQPVEKPGEGKRNQGAGCSHRKVSPISKCSRRYVTQ